MQTSLISEGLTLMLAGMGTVFVFLTVLVFAMTVMSAIAGRSRPVAEGPTDDEVAAITAAVHQHRRGQDN